MFQPRGASRHPAPGGAGLPKTNSGLEIGRLPDAAGVALRRIFMVRARNPAPEQGGPMNLSMIQNLVAQQTAGLRKQAEAASRARHARRRRRAADGGR
jgi:hypothetical protein